MAHLWRSYLPPPPDVLVAILHAPTICVAARLDGVGRVQLTAMLINASRNVLIPEPQSRTYAMLTIHVQMTCVALGLDTVGKVNGIAALVNASRSVLLPGS